MKTLYLAAVTALMFTPALAQTTGLGGSVIQGSAGPAGTTDASRVEKCDHPFGALAVLEPQDFMERELIRYGLQSPTQPLRLIVQQSNCFTVVERGMALRSLQQERDLQRAGELRSGSSMGKGQMIAADYVLIPKINGIRICAEPSSSAEVLGTLGKDGEMVFLGDEQNGFLHVQDATGEGRVQAILVRRAD